MIDEPNLENRPAQSYAAISLHAPIPFGHLLPALWDELLDWLAGQGLAPAGAPFIRYLETDMTRPLCMEIGWPTPTLLAGSERVLTGWIPAGQYATLLYTGPYDNLVEVTAAFLAWAKTNHITWQTSEATGVERWAGRFEHYLTDPGQEPNPTKWQTELAFLTR